MTNTGIGQDGYMWYQKEAVFGTEIATSKIFLPVKPGSLIKSSVSMIENANIIQSRVKQAPNLGREVVNAEVLMDVYPDIFGGIIELFLGGASSGSAVDSTYIHTWLVPITGERIGESATFGQALGADTEDRYAGNTITKINFKQTVDGNLESTITMVGQDHSTEGGSRATASGYSTTIPLNFSFPAITITPDGGSAIAVDVDDLEIEIDLGYDEERFKLGSKNISQPVFNTIPSVSVKFNCDAQRAFVDHARTHKSFTIDIAFTSTEYAGGTTPYLFEFEIPNAKLMPETEIPFENDRASMSLEFDASYGGTTTGSGSDSVMGEIRLKDGNATWT